MRYIPHYELGGSENVAIIAKNLEEPYQKLIDASNTKWGYSILESANCGIGVIKI